MIVEMRKYSFLIYHGDYEKFLDDVRELGVLHVAEKGTGLDDETLEQKYVLKNLLLDTKRFLSRRVPAGEKVTDVADGIEIANEVDELKAGKDKLEQQLAVLSKEKDLMEPWGEFSFESVDKLKETDLAVDFYTCSARRFKPGWEEQYYIGKINEVNGVLYFVVFKKSGEEVILDADPAKLPGKPLSQITSELENASNELASINQRFDQLATRLDLIEDAEKVIDSELSYRKVFLNTKKEAENKLMVLEGYVPVTKEENLKNYLEESGIYYQGENVDPDDKNVPVLLKNNKYARLYEPVGKLFSLPAYKELDLTPFFAPFFTLFFGFCLGDAGYGVLILLATTIYKAKWAKPEIKPILSLAQWLGLATVIMGTVSGTLFGINLIIACF